MVWSLKVESIWGGYWTVAPLIFFYFFIFSGFYFQSSDQNQTWPNSKRYTRWWSGSHSHSGHLCHPCPGLHSSGHPSTHRPSLLDAHITTLWQFGPNMYLWTKKWPFMHKNQYKTKIDRPTGHSCMKTNIKPSLTNGQWKAMKLPWKNMKTN